MSDTEEDRTEEIIDWDEEKKNAVQGHPPDAKYGSASENIRHSMSHTKICAMFCKGKKCKFDNPTPWTKAQMEIDGLYSNWITGNILAMARPNTPIIKQYNIIDQFKRVGIKSIINLQLPGEHATCGHGLEPDGFTYSQQEFMENEIYFYNFGWQDYGVGSLSNILDMVKVMQFAISEGKVAVHCHAGLGRTGVLIACYLVYANRMSPWDVVHYIRSKRPPSIQTRSQLVCIEEFAQYLKPLRIVFSSVQKDAHDFALSQYLTRQKHLLHGYEARKLKFIPKIIYECCERLLFLAGHKQHHHRHHHDNRKDVLKTASSALNNKGPHPRSSSIFQHSQSSPSSGNGGLKKKSVSLESFTALGGLRKATSALSVTSSVASELSDSDSVHSNPLAPSTSSDTDISQHRAHSESRTDLSKGPKQEVVAVAMAQSEYDAHTRAAIDELKMSVNQGEVGWKGLQRCQDCEVLAGVMWDWIDHLREPILSAQDLPDVLEFTAKPKEGLSLLSKGARCTVEFLFKTIAILDPLSDEAERNLVQRVLSTLTHQNMIVETEVLLSQEKYLIKRTSNNTGLMREGVANKMMYFFMHLIHIMKEEIKEDKKMFIKMQKKLLEEEQLEKASEYKKRPKQEKASKSSSVKPRPVNGMRLERKKSFEAEDVNHIAKKGEWQPSKQEQRILAEEQDSDESESEEDVVTSRRVPTKNSSSSRVTKR